MQFELTLHGYDGGSDETDCLVKWVVAPTRAAVESWLSDTGLDELVATFETLSLPGDRPLVHEDGVDVVIDFDSPVGRVVRWHPAYAKVKPEQRWFEQVDAVRSES